MPHAFGTRLKVTALLSLLASCGLPDDVGQRRAESHGEEACFPLSCIEVTTAPTDDAGPFTPDLRPVAILQLWGGNYTCGDPVTGSAPWYQDGNFDALNATCADGPNRADWEDDGCVRRVCEIVEYKAAWAGDGKPDIWNKMQQELDEIYSWGFRRIVLNRPAGRYQFDSPTGKDYPPSSQFWPLEDLQPDMWKIVRPRGASPPYLQEWAELRGVTLGVYAGYRIHDPCSLWGHTAGHHLPDPWDYIDMCTAQQNIDGWARPFRTLAGTQSFDMVEEFWMDNTSKPAPDPDGGPIAARDSFVAFSRSAQWGSQSNDLKFVGESIPSSVSSPTHYELDERYVTKSAWTQRLATFELRTRNGDASPPPDQVSENVPDMTGVNPRELHAIIQPCPLDEPCTETIDTGMVENYIRRGYLPAAWHVGSNVANLSTLKVVADTCRRVSGIPKSQPLTRCRP